MTETIRNNHTSITILRRKQVESRTGLSRFGIYERIAEGRFPTPIKLGGGRAVGWLEHEINNWLLSRIEESRSATRRKSTMASNDE